MALNFSITGDVNITDASPWIKNISNPCQAFVDEQEAAISNIYNQYHNFLLAVVFYFIFSMLVEKSIHASARGKWKILWKEFDFHLSEEAIKYLLSINNIFRFTLMGIALIYFVLGTFYN